MSTGLVALAQGNSAVSCGMGEQRRGSENSQGQQSVSRGYSHDPSEEGTPNILVNSGLCGQRKAAWGCDGC